MERVHKNDTSSNKPSSKCSSIYLCSMFLMYRCEIVVSCISRYSDQFSLHVKQLSAQKQRVCLQYPSRWAIWANILLCCLRFSCVGGDICDWWRHKWKCAQQGAAYENARSARSFPGPQQLYSNLVTELEAVTPKQHFPKHWTPLTTSTTLPHFADHLVSYT